MILLRSLFVLLFLALFLPALVFALQVGLALPALKRKRELCGVRPRIAVLVPAHNESAGIIRPLNTIRAQLRAEDRVLVVADNCTDDTAEIARANGAEVIVRSDAERRGKGYALDFGVRHLEASPPGVVIVVDADCLVHGNALDLLARRCAESGKPVQALYLMHAPPGAGLKAKVAEFASAVKNRVRSLGYCRVGLPCQLMGTGMAFPWHLIRRAELASGHIVEDLMLGLDFAEAGHAPQFCPEATVTSTFPANTEGMRSQRMRWEHGHLSVLLREGPRRLMKSLATRNADLFTLVVDMCVPPLALLTLLVLSLCVVGSVLWGVTGVVLPWALAFLNLMLLAIAVLMAWIRFGRGILSLNNLAYAPFYALGKVPLYLRFLIKRQVEWVRSRRD